MRAFLSESSAKRSDPAMKKSELPVKTCPVCGRDFAWRKKWARDWAQVIYCSDACRKGTPRGRPLRPKS